jgi:hypothetical protein
VDDRVEYDQQYAWLKSQGLLAWGSDNRRGRLKERLEPFHQFIPETHICTSVCLAIPGVLALLAGRPGPQTAAVRRSVMISMLAARSKDPFSSDRIIPSLGQGCNPNKKAFGKSWTFQRPAFYLQLAAY